MNTYNPALTKRGKPRLVHRYHHVADYSACKDVLPKLLAAGLNRTEIAFELSRRGVKTPGGSPTWNIQTVQRAAKALGL